MTGREPARRVFEEIRSGTKISSNAGDEESKKKNLPLFSQ
jgi:hypothetical protein